MNNQPYFRYSHLDDVERHRAGWRLSYLRDRLRELDELDEDEALAALAAFIRSRTEAEWIYVGKVRVLPPTESVPELVNAITEFLDPDRSDDRPLRLQAVVGGLVKTIGVPVSAQGITDPSRHAPGDVHVPNAEQPTWTAEVKGRSVVAHEVIAFLDKARDYGIPAVWIVVIAQTHEPLDRIALSAIASDRAMLVTIIEDIVELVTATLGHPLTKPSMLKNAATAIGSQLRDMNAEGRTLDAWSDACTQNLTNRAS